MNDAPRPERLLFVYNVDASPVALLRDLYSGLTTGSTDCHLCDLTFGRLLKDRTWKQFVAALPLDVEFQLKSTFRRRPGAPAETFPAETFPAAFWEFPDGTLERAIGAETINEAEDLESLRSLVERVVKSR